jgi:hypothetical protein
LSPSPAAMYRNQSHAYGYQHSQSPSMPHQHSSSSMTISTQPITEYATSTQRIEYDYINTANHRVCHINSAHRVWLSTQPIHSYDATHDCMLSTFTHMARTYTGMTRLFTRLAPSDETSPEHLQAHEQQPDTTRYTRSNDTTCSALPQHTFNTPTTHLAMESPPLTTSTTPTTPTGTAKGRITPYKIAAANTPTLVQAPMMSTAAAAPPRLPPRPTSLGSRR